MLTPATPQEARKGIPPTIRVVTESNGRIEKPEKDPDAFGAAARLALDDANEHGFGAVAFEAVSEFVKRDADDHVVKNFAGDVMHQIHHVRLVFEYHWTFTAWGNSGEAL